MSMMLAGATPPWLHITATGFTYSKQMTPTPHSLSRWPAGPVRRDMMVFSKFSGCSNRNLPGEEEGFKPD